MFYFDLDLQCIYPGYAVTEACMKREYTVQQKESRVFIKNRHCSFFSQRNHVIRFGNGAGNKQSREKSANDISELRMMATDGPWVAIMLTVDTENAP